MSIRNYIDTLVRKLEKDYAVHNRIEISRSALLHNLDLFEGLSGLPAIPVLKANAYGHGVRQVAEAFKGYKLPYIAVDGYFEALRIRKVSKQPVLVMGAILPQNFARLRYDDFTFVVHDAAAIDALGKTGKRIKVHLEVNTGMNRYGAPATEIAMLTKRILEYKNLTLEGIMSHLADSDGADPATVVAAVERFDSSVELVRATGANPTLIHIAQSAGSVKAKSKYANAFRLGIGLYGIQPFPQAHPLRKKLKGLQPALRFVSTITQLTDLQKGDQVSYNYTFTAPRGMQIATIPVGYYEGINRALSNTGYVTIGNAWALIVGRVCMNHTMINVDGLDAHVGDEVVVISNKSGDKNTIDAIADANGLFNYNLATALSSDVRRILVD